MRTSGAVRDTSRRPALTPAAVVVVVVVVVAVVVIVVVAIIFIMSERAQVAGPSCISHQAKAALTYNTIRKEREREMYMCILEDCLLWCAFPLEMLCCRRRRRRCCPLTRAIRIQFPAAR